MGRRMAGLKQVFTQDLATIRDTPILWPLALLVFVSDSISFVSLRALSVVVPACFLVALVILIVQTRRFPKPSIGTVIVWLVFVVLVGLAALQSMNVDYASGRFVKLASVSLLAVLFWALAARVSGLLALRPVLILSLVIGLGWAFVEGLSDGAIFALTRDVAENEAAHAANRPIVLLVVFLWPATLALSQILQQKAVWLLLLLTLGATFTTESQSAQLAMVAASVVFALALLLPRAGLWMVGIGGVIAILALPFVFASFNMMLNDESVWASKMTVLPRLELWRFVSEKIVAQPLLGYGLEAGRFMPLDDMTQQYFGGTHMHHPHNAILQIWFEMGLLGAVAIALGWALLVRQIGGLAPQSQAYPLAAATCVLIVGTVSHGLWQTWWLSALTVVPFFFAIALAGEPKPKK